MANSGVLLLYVGSDPTNIRKVLDARGLGPENMIREATVANPPLYTETTDGFWGFDACGPDQIAATAEGYAVSGVVPTDDRYGNPIDWSEWGLTEQEVEDATASYHCYSANTTVSLHDYFDNENVRQPGWISQQLASFGLLIKDGPPE